MFHVISFEKKKKKKLKSNSSNDMRTTDTPYLKSLNNENNIIIISVSNGWKKVIEFYL